MLSFTIQQKKVNVYPADDPNQPIIYFHAVANMGNSLYRALQNIKSPDHTLVAINGLKWNRDMTPWDCPPISRFDTPCTGGADAYLQILIGEIIPKVEDGLGGQPTWRGVAGYSLAGLFTVYAPYQTDVFSRIASMSGSLWFPDFKEYVFSHDMKRRPDHIYLSLGDKESKTKNPFLSTTQDNTAEIQKFYADQGIDSIFQLNPGGHHSNSMKRTATGIDWILRR